MDAVRLHLPRLAADAFEKERTRLYTSRTDGKAERFIQTTLRE